MKLLPLLILPFLWGCMNIAPILKQLKDDPATVDITAVNPMYGSFIFHRAYPTNFVGGIKGP
jgi:hypothetical protein